MSIDSRGALAINAALRASELSYRRLFEAAQDGILILDVETGRVDDVNPFLTNLLGFTHSEMVGKTVGELSPFRDVVSNQAMLERLQKDGYVRYEHLPLEARNGRTLAVEFVCNVYEVGDRKVIQCNIRDITDRKRIEQQLNLLETCLGNINDVVLVTEAGHLDEPEPRIIYANKAVERITGYTTAEVLGHSPRFLQGRNSNTHILAEIRQALMQQKPIRREIINYAKDGREYWVDIDIVPILDAVGKCTHFAAIERDVTESKRKESRFRLLVESNAQGVFFWNTKGEITGANDAFLKLLQYTREDLEAGRMNWVALTPPEHAHLDQNALEELAETRVCTPYEKEFVLKDGSRVPVLLGAAMFEDDPTEGVCFAIDLTESKRLEQQFLRAQRMESIGTLAGGIAHDLNNILAPIMMSIDLLKGMSKDPLATTILETIEVSAQRGADIVRQVLSFARGMEGERMEVQPKHLLQDIETIIKDTFPKSIRREFSLPNNLWKILGDPTQLHQILLNLCVNARDAMPDGGSLDIIVENTVLDEHYAAMHLQARAGRYVCINVTDSGTGIPPAVLDKIFEPFFTTKALGKGTGLGLSTVMAIVKSHDGFINAYSELGKGTTFKVYLPAIEVSSEARGDTTALPAPPRGRGETVLVVDDEASILTITTRTLEAFGYRTMTAGDGAEAVALYAQNRDRINVVLTDMAMPIMDGAATIRALRKINPAIKIIAASGLNANEGMTKVSSEDVNHFLTKPYTAGTLLNALRAILDEA